jgi:hypothetical protein
VTPVTESDDSHTVNPNKFLLSLVSVEHFLWARKCRLVDMTRGLQLPDGMDGAIVCLYIV